MSRLIAFLLSVFVVSTALAQNRPLVIHEWGTFTSLHDESGRTLDRINSDDEPVPAFVHSMLPGNTIPQSQGYRAGDPLVTMRLETPVLYVYAPGNSAAPLPRLDVAVDFVGGLLTQYYPDVQEIKVDGLTSASRGRLVWSGLTLGGDKPGPTTSAHVWTAPRRPKSLAITTSGGESESYLFYRGVGNLDAPIKVSQDRGEIQISGRMKDVETGFARLWLCEFHSDGQVAWKAIDGLASQGTARLPAEFSTGEFSAKNLESLRADMHAALVADGLYPDEAAAMLDTWELSYFKSWGTRLFYIVPRGWTDKVLPIDITPAPSELKRVMVGRIDLVTPQHRALLKQLAAYTDPKTQLPLMLNTYFSLGRFRFALAQDELKARPSPVLEQFIREHGLKSYSK